ncbi:MAG: N-acetylmuramoyl-L-alanine amidase, partial [Candidatus Eremiobacteraeota bacterium]|nr:N-acetylmuramoyl-L-alanine amidase [Candidatus Eremiobacteraeota bacterium]
MNRFTVPIFRALSFALFAVAVAVAPAIADAPVKALYGAQVLVFAHVSTSQGQTAVGVNDPGLRALLRASGAGLTWRPGDRYVLLTTAAPVVVSFAVGDRRYDIGSISLEAAIAPYTVGDEVYLPLNEVLRALDLALRQDGPVSVLQPQLDALDVRVSANRADVIAHAGVPLRPRIVAESATSVTYEFDGVGTTLAGTRNVNAGGIHTLQIVQNGTVRAPRTMVIVTLAPGAVRQPPRSNNDRDVEIAFSGPGAAAPPLPQEQVQPQEQAANAPQSQAPVATGPATVTGVSVTPSGDGYVLAIAVDGNAPFEWHRLRDPDNRFWVDIKGAQLQGPPVEQNEPSPLGALRVRQVDPATVRVALSLSGPKSLTVTPSSSGLNVEIGRNDVADVPRAGNGSVGSVIAAGEQTAMVTPAPLGESQPTGDESDSSWKFGPRSTYVPTNPRLIVIDPGHGGSDRGSSRHGVDEADLALDMSKRLRDILVARGWQVRLTRDTDVDVYQP